MGPSYSSLPGVSITSTIFNFLGGIAESIQLVRNEIPFGRDTHVVANNAVLDRGPGPPMRRGIWGSEPE